MTNVRQMDLTHIYYQIHYEIDDGNTAPIKGAQDAIVDGEVIDYLERNMDHLDLSLFDQPELDEIDDAFTRYGVYDNKRTGAYKNGLAMISSNIVMMLQNGNWRDPASNLQINPPDLELQ